MMTIDVEVPTYLDRMARVAVELAEQANKEVDAEAARSRAQAALAVANAIQALFTSPDGYSAVSREAR